MNIENISKLVTLLGNGSSTVVAVVAMYFYVELPLVDRSSFLVLLVVLAIINMIGQLVAAVVHRLEIKSIYNKAFEVNKASKNVEQRIIRVREQEPGVDHMTDIWEYQ